MDDAGELRRQQLAFAHHVRDPGHHPAPAGVDARGLRTYRRLFLGGITSLLAGNFPVIRRTLGPGAWQALVEAFYAGHRCTTPLFTEVAGEFVAWLAGRDPRASGDPAWLAELAHYEWIELELQVAEPGAPSAHGADGGVGGPGDGDVLALSALARPLAYRWPVHRIGPGWRPEARPPAEPTLLLARRDADGDVRFSVLSPLVYRLLQLLGGADGTHAVGGLLDALATEAGRVGDAAFLDEGRRMLARLLREGTVVRVLC